MVVSGIISNDGNFSNAVGHTLTISSGGSLSNTANGAFTNDGTLTNNATVTNMNGGHFFNTGTLGGSGLYLNQNGGTWTFTNAGATSITNLQNDGDVDFSGMGGGLTINTLTGSTGTFTGGANTLTVNNGTYTGNFGAMGAFVKATGGGDVDS